LPLHTILFDIAAFSIAEMSWWCRIRLVS